MVAAWSVHLVSGFMAIVYEPLEIGM